MSYRFRRKTLVAGLIVLAGVTQGCSLRPNEPESTDRGARGDALQWRPATDVVVCDDTEQLVGTIEGAEPGEQLAFVSSQPIDVPAVAADGAGLAELVWSCGPEESRLRWTMIATGQESERWVELVVTGSHETTGFSELMVTIGDGGSSGPVVCDGRRRQVGLLTNAASGESILFDSRQTAELQSGRADELGQLEIFWSCRPDDVGDVWEITATGNDSQRSGTFVLEGVAPDPEQELPIEITIIEDPVVCDEESGVFARLANFVPGELVSFVSAETTELLDGVADADGNLDLFWQCGEEDVGRNWTLDVIGQESRKQTTLTITGVADPAGYPDTPPATVVLIEQPFVCDDERRPVAEISGLRGGEFVDFSSEQSGPLLEGRADPEGRLTVNWQCTRAELAALAPATAWTVTATGRESGQTVTFVITGSGL